MPFRNQLALCCLALGFTVACGDDGASQDPADSGDTAQVGTTDAESADTDGGSTGGPGSTTDEATDVSTGGSATGDTTGTADDTAGSDGTTGEPAADPYVAGGTLIGLAGYEDTVATGFAVIARAQDGTRVSLQVSDLAPDTMYPTHVHVQACDDGAGGGHYKLDLDVRDTVEDNELWLPVLSDENGVARVEISSDHVARGDAVAVVIHDPTADNAKMLCADLGTSGDVDPLVTTGTQTLLQGATDAGFDSMTAEVTLQRSVADGTSVTLSVTGLGADQMYPAHVHDRDCASADGGGHYKIDYAVAATEQANELWLPVPTDAAGAGEMTITNEHLAHAAAQSVVIHNNDGGGARLACIDLDVDS